MSDDYETLEAQKAAIIARRHQAITDRVMRTMAIRHGSSTRRDFEVVGLVLDAVLGSGTDSSQAKHSDATRRSEAP